MNHNNSSDVTADANSHAVEEQENASAATHNGGDAPESEHKCGDASLEEDAADTILNNAVELPTQCKKRQLALDSNTKINNVFNTRSRSAESHISSYSSRMTSRSSSGSLCNTYRVRTGSKRNRSMKNSSSTRSDTGLVLRCHRGRCQGVHPCKRPTKHQSPASSCNLRVCNSMECMDVNHNYNLHKTQSDTFQRGGSYRLNKHSTSFR